MPKILEHTLLEKLLRNQAFYVATIPKNNHKIPWKMGAVVEQLFAEQVWEGGPSHPKSRTWSWVEGQEVSIRGCTYISRALEVKRSLNWICLSTEQQWTAIRGELYCMKHKSFGESVVYYIVSTEKHIWFKIHVIISKYKVLKWLLWRAASFEQCEDYYQAHLCAQYWFEFL